MNLNQPKIESLRNPEIEKLETGHEIFDFLDHVKFLEIRKSDEKFDNWIKNLSYDDYSDYLTRLNGILRKSPIKKRNIDGQNVQISGGMGIGYLPPSADQKDNLLKKSFEGMKQISDNSDRALLSYYSIQAIHPYLDGNGRTGRLLHEIISEEGKNLTEDRLSKLLDHDSQSYDATGPGRNDFAAKVMEPSKAYYFINREVSKEFLGQDFLNEYGKIFISAEGGYGSIPESTKKELSQEEISLAEKILGESDVFNFSFRGIVLVKLINEINNLRKYQYPGDPKYFILGDKSGVVFDDIGKNTFCIDGEDLMKNLTAEQVKRLIEIHKEVKGKFINTMIDIFVNKDNHKIKDSNLLDHNIRDVLSK